MTPSDHTKRRLEARDLQDQLFTRAESDYTNNLKDQYREAAADLYSNREHSNAYEALKTVTKQAVEDGLTGAMEKYFCMHAIDNYYSPGVIKYLAHRGVDVQPIITLAQLLAG